MRNLAIYDDKIYLATTDARLVALDARTGKKVWNTVIADGSKGFGNSSGPIVVKGKVIQGLRRLRPLPRGALLHQRLRRRDRQAGVEVPHRRPRRRAGRRHLEQPAEHDAPGRRDVDCRQLRPRRGPHVLGRRAGQAVDAGEPRHAALRRRPAHGLDRGAQSRHRRARLALPAPAGRDARPRRGVTRSVSVDAGAQKALFTIGKSGILWKMDRKTGALLDFTETIFQNVYTDIDKKTGRATYRGDILEQKVDQWIAVVPEHRGRPQLAGDDLSPGHAGAGDSAQPVVHGDRAAQGGAGGRPGRHRGRAPLLRDARQRRQHRQARGLRRAHAEGAVERGAARAVPHRGALDRRRAGVHRRPRSLLPRLRREDRQGVVADAARHLGAGLPGVASRPAASSTSR